MDKKININDNRVIIAVGSVCLLIILLIGSILIYKTATRKTGNDLKVIAGDDRYDTAVKVSQSVFVNSKNVVLASGEGFADALSGGQLAHSLEAPILLTDSKRLNDSVWKEILRLKVENIYILGGNASISKDIERRLSKYMKVIRIAGSDRYKTSYKVMKETMKHGKFKKLVLASGESFPDALSASNYIASDDMLLLLTDGNTVPKLDMETIAVGGKKYMPLEGFTGKRISGEDRYDTAFKIAKECFKNPDDAILASGEDYPDALTAISLIGKYDSPILLTEKTFLKKYISKFINENKKKLVVVGGNGSINLGDICKDIVENGGGRIAKKGSKNGNTKVSVKNTVKKKSQPKKSSSTDLSNVKYIEYVGTKKESGIKYPNGKIVEIYRFFNGYGDIAVVQSGPNSSDAGYSKAYDGASFWYCTKGKEPSLIAEKGPMEGRLDTFKVIKKRTGYFLGVKMQFDAGGSGASTYLFGIAFDKNGKYMKGPYTPNAPVEFDYFDISPGQDIIKAPIVINSSGKLEYGDSASADRSRVKSYSSKLAGAYCIVSGFYDNGGGHYWNPYPVTIVPDSNGFAIKVLENGGNNSQADNSSESSGPDYFVDKEKLIKINMPSGFGKEIAYSTRDYHGETIYDFYIKKARSQFERKNNSSGYGGEVMSLGIVKSSVFNSDSALSGSDEEMSGQLSIGQVEKNGVTYEVVAIANGSFDVMPDNDNERSQYNAWAEKCHKCLANIQGYGGSKYVRNAANLSMIGVN